MYDASIVVRIYRIVSLVFDYSKLIKTFREESCIENQNSYGTT